MAAIQLPIAELQQAFEALLAAKSPSRSNGGGRRAADCGLEFYATNLAASPELPE